MISVLYSNTPSWSGTESDADFSIFESELLDALNEFTGLLDTTLWTKCKDEIGCSIFHQKTDKFGQSATSIRSLYIVIISFQIAVTPLLVVMLSSHRSK